MLSIDLNERALPLWVLCSVLLLLAGLYKGIKKQGQLPLPPGPKPLPIIGNLHQMPQAQRWQAFREWANKYGPIVHLNVAGQSLVVLSTNDAAHGLLSKRSALYSERPRLVMANDLVTKGMHMLLRPYDAAYKLHQRMEAPLLNPRAARCYRPLQELESRQLILDVLRDADEQGQRGGGAGAGVDVHHHFQRAAGSFIYALAYGYRLRTGREQALEDAKRVQDEVSQNGALGGAHLVDAFPWLNRLPARLAPWKAEAEALYRLERDLHLGNMAQGMRRPGWNFTKHYARDCREAEGMAPVEVAFDLGIVADAALDTTTVALMWLAVAWITCGERWAGEAQRVLDEVVGRDRLPQFEDRERLALIDAIVHEVLRWRPVLPSGFPHATKKEDTYLGYRIPAGSMVIGSHFNLSREEAVFGSNTDEFNPDRWLGEDGTLKDLPQVGWGFGRRICTGRHIARNNLFILVARLLWAFDMEGAVSPETGERVLLEDMAGSEGFVWSPKPFRAIVKPRGPWVRELLERQGETHDVDHAEILDQAARERMIHF